MNIAIVPVYEPWVCTQWLGDCTILERTLRKLREIRDLDAIVLVTQLSELVKSVTADDPSLVHQQLLSPIHSLVRLTRMITTTAKEGTVYIAVNPLFPFLDRGKIEKALYSVVETPASSVITAYGDYSLQQSVNRFKVVSGPGYQKSPVNACTALAIAGKIEMGDMNLLGCAYTEVPIDAIEAIDIGTPEGLRIAEALTASGII